MWMLFYYLKLYTENIILGWKERDEHHAGKSRLVYHHHLCLHFLSYASYGVSTGWVSLSSNSFYINMNLP